MRRYLQTGIVLAAFFIGSAVLSAQYQITPGGIVRAWMQITDYLILGSETTSGIRLDVSSGTFRVREGDNSADGPMSAGAATFNGATTAGGYNADAGGYFAWTGRNLFRSTANGVTSIRNAAETNTYDITLADWGTKLSAEGVSVAVDGVLFLGAAPNGTVHLNITDISRYCMFLARGSNNVTAEFLDPDGNCSVTKDTAGLMNFYYDAAGSSGAGYYIQNKGASTRTYRVLLVGV